jgi:hypothetical protein
VLRQGEQEQVEEAVGKTDEQVVQGVEPPWREDFLEEERDKRQQEEKRGVRERAPWR